MDIASLVIGIIAVAFGFIPCLNVFIFIPAVIGLILGIISFNKKKQEGLPTGLALAGIILNGLPILFGLSCVTLGIVGGEVEGLEAIESTVIK